MDKLTEVKTGLSLFDISDERSLDEEHTKVLLQQQLLCISHFIAQEEVHSSPGNLLKPLTFSCLANCLCMYLLTNV